MQCGEDLGGVRECEMIIGPSAAAAAALAVYSYWEGGEMGRWDWLESSEGEWESRGREVVSVWIAPRL